MKEPDRLLAIHRRRVAGSGLLAEGVFGGLQDVAEDFLVEAFLPAEVVADERTVALGLGGDVPDARSVETPVGEALEAGFQQG